MGLRDRLAKVFGTRPPADVQAGEEAAGMTASTPFSPGQPIAPYDGYSRVPRTQDYNTGYNISQRPKANERVAFDTLRGLIDSYDVAQTCIWHRIDSIRSLDWSIVPTAGFKGDAEEAILTATEVMKKPDRQTPFNAWLGAWLYDILAFDAGALYRMRNRGGRAVGLRVIDGTTIAPLLDYWGNSPEDPAAAYVQYAQGLAWNHLTRKDLVYQPFRWRSNTPYGFAPLESILLNANTDLRFQAYFLQRFTEGNIPAAFASAPESWTPQQIEEFQGYWDAFLLGDQSAKSQIRWMPGGGKIEWSNEKDFSDGFSLFLMRKTCAAYHVVPADLGFTETVNKSSGETQADVGHRIGDRPLATYVQGIITDFLQSDMGLPVRFMFDLGEGKEDRLALAQAWSIYIDKGMASPDEGREELIGLPADPNRPVPRFYATSNDGPVPLLAIEGIAGKTDPETFAPAQDQPPLRQPFVPAPAVSPAEGTADDAVADAAYDAYQSEVRETAARGDAPVAKEPAAGITTATGVTSYDLLDDEDEPEGDDEAELTKREMTAFRSFRKARRRARTWRNFEFRHVDPVTGQRLNQAGRAQLRKDAGEIACAGLAVQAVDTGRVLMLQRALDPTDPAGGTWEFPGGHLDEGENPVAAAMREWAEETRLILPFDPDGIAALAFQNCPKWRRGIYAGFVYRIATEDSIDLTGRDQVNNPDDPDGDCIEALAWWDPAQLPGNPAVRAELLDDLDVVLPALGLEETEGPEYPEDGTETVCPCGMTARFDAMDGWQHLDGSHGHTDGESVAEKLGFRKAAAADPKGDAPAEGAPLWPGWQYDEAVADYWAQQLADVYAGTLTAEEAEQIVRAYHSAEPPAEGDEPPTMAALVALAVLLLTARLNMTGAITKVLRGLYADAYAVGAASAGALLDGTPVDLDGWAPGDTAAAQRVIDRLGVNGGLDVLLAAVTDRAKQAVVSRVNDAARVLARGTIAGDSPAKIGRALLDVITSLSRARTLALTETTRASNHAAYTVYRRAEYEPAGAWLIDPHNPCKACTANGAASPLPLGDTYPSGDAYPPVHPNCRCALVPIGDA